MSLAETVLQKVADWRPASSRERQTLGVSHPESGWAVFLTANRCDDLGCLLWEVQVRQARGDAAGPRLADWAANVAERVSGLLEHLHVLEVDVTRDQALLRSREPSQRNNEIFYYEILLEGSRQAELRRYKALPNGGGRREQIAFALTHEALAKLAHDITGA